MEENMDYNITYDALQEEPIPIYMKHREDADSPTIIFILFIIMCVYVSMLCTEHMQYNHHRW